MQTQLLKDLTSMYGPEAAGKAESVMVVVQAKVSGRNLFGWRSYIEQLLLDLVGYMITTDFQYSGGAYVACGIQAALDSSRYCSAKKRRDRYDNTSNLDDLEYKVSVDISSSTVRADFLEDIKASFGEELQKALEPFISGKVSKLTKDVIEKCKTEEFKRWLENYRDL